jgi:hypothetical protein
VGHPTFVFVPASTKKDNMLPVEMGRQPITYLECRLEVQKAGCCDTVCAVIMALR